MKTQYGSADIVKRVAPSGGVTSGVAIMIGTQLLVPLATAAEGIEFEAATRGVFRIVKTAGGGTGAAAGVKAYWTTAASAISALSAGGVLIGAFDLVAADGDTVARVYVDGAIR